MKWIDVTDSLPGYNKNVLFVHNGCVYAGSIGPGDVGLKFYHAEDCFQPKHITDVRWWMPYPEPPNSQEARESVNSSASPVQQLKSAIAIVREFARKQDASSGYHSFNKYLDYLSQQADI